MGRARILLADDHTLFCAAIRKLLEPHFEVVGAVSDGLAMLREARLLKPDVVLLDIGMPLLNGLDAGRELKQTLPQTKLVYLTMNVDSDLAAEALRIGASAYLLKTAAESELLRAIQDALQGKSHVTADIRRGMMETFIRDPKAAQRRRRLTLRQREVLQLLAEGRSMKEAASILHITARTVAFHKYNIMDELGVTTNAALVQYAIKQGMLPTS